jgi:transcriptional regulator with XRE-family HTH domain
VSEIGAAVLAERTRQGIDLEWLAERTGYSARSLQRLERGEALSAYTLACVLSVLGVRLVVRLDPVGGAE